MIVTFVAVKRKIYAISLLLSFLVVLSHQVISHHHHDTIAYEFSTSLEKVDEQEHVHHDKHHHHHDSHEESDNEKDTDKEHNHRFPLHQHVTTTNVFDCTRTSSGVKFEQSEHKNICLFIHIP